MAIHLSSPFIIFTPLPGQKTPRTRRRKERKVIIFKSKQLNIWIVWIFVKKKNELWILSLFKVFLCILGAFCPGSGESSFYRFSNTQPTIIIWEFPQSTKLLASIRSPNSLSLSKCLPPEYLSRITAINGTCFGTLRGWGWEENWCFPPRLDPKSDYIIFFVKYLKFIILTSSIDNCILKFRRQDVTIIRKKC